MGIENPINSIPDQPQLHDSSHPFRRDTNPVISTRETAAEAFTLIGLGLALIGSSNSNAIEIALGLIGLGLGWAFGKPTLDKLAG